MKALWLGGRCGLLCALALSLGCGGGRGTVSGQVSYRGQPVPGGFVMFCPVEGGKSPVHAQLDENGHYEVTAVPAGDVIITVDNEEWKPVVREPGPAPQLPPGIKLPPEAKAPPQAAPPRGAKTVPSQHPGKYVPIPARYARAETSGLTYTVKPGPQSYDFELK